jgi:deoxycytidine triphosphate deaminase
MILSAQSILKLINEKALIQKYASLKQCQPCSFDLRVGTIYNLVGMGTISTMEKKLPNYVPKEPKNTYYFLKEGEYVLVETIEVVKMPPNLCGFIKPRSTLQRLGAVLRTALVDPGYSGTLTFGLKAEHSLKIQEGSPFCSIYFYLLDRPTITTYTGKYKDTRTHELSGAVLPYIKS